MMIGLVIFWTICSKSAADFRLFFVGAAFRHELSPKLSKTLKDHAQNAPCCILYHPLSTETFH
jgi:hypothetical protein